MLNTKTRRFIFVVAIPIIIWLVGFTIHNTWIEENEAFGIGPAFVLGASALITLIICGGVVFAVMCALLGIYKWIMDKKEVEKEN